MFISKQHVLNLSSKSFHEKKSMSLKNHLPPKQMIFWKFLSVEAFLWCEEGSQPAEQLSPPSVWMLVRRQLCHSHLMLVRIQCTGHLMNSAVGHLNMWWSHLLWWKCIWCFFKFECWSHRKVPAFHWVTRKTIYCFLFAFVFVCAMECSLSLYTLWFVYVLRCTVGTSAV